MLLGGNRTVLKQLQRLSGSKGWLQPSCAGAFNIITVRLSHVDVLLHGSVLGAGGGGGGALQK